MRPGIGIAFVGVAPLPSAVLGVVAAGGAGDEFRRAILADSERVGEFAAAPPLPLPLPSPPAESSESATEVWCAARERGCGETGETGPVLACVFASGSGRVSGSMAARLALDSICTIHKRVACLCRRTENKAVLQGNVCHSARTRQHKQTLQPRPWQSAQSLRSCCG